MWLRITTLGALSFVALSACSDGVGVPIRRQATEQEQDRDAASDEDGGFDESDHYSDELDEEHCESTFDWPQTYAEDEAALLDAINALRRNAIRCGDGDGDGESTAALRPLRLSAALRCSARLHSRDMVERDFIDRINPDGEGPRDRMRAAGYRLDEANESLAIGERTADGALEQLLDDRDDCLNVATRRLSELGIGRYEDRWTLDFARD